MRPWFLLCAVAAAGCASERVPGTVVQFAKDVQPNGTFVLEMADDGSIYHCEAQIPFDQVPAACRETAKRLEPDAEWIDAEKELAGGRIYYEIVVRKDGKRVELLMLPDGTLGGREDALSPGQYPQAVADAGIRAAGGGDLVAVESVTGPEAATGEDYHVKVRNASGEVQRVSVREDGSVVRVMRKIKAEVRVHR